MGKRNDAISTVPYMLDALRVQKELYVNPQCKTCRYFHDYDVRCMICDDENDMHEERKGGRVMTNQEAIRLIRNLPTMCEFTDAYGEPIDSDAYYDAVDMAISALNAQPQIVHCKDCIKREICRTSTTWAVAPKDDWYCADAERRASDDDWRVYEKISTSRDDWYCAGAERRTDGV